MTIKRKLSKLVNGKREFYLDDRYEYHTFQEIKELCYRELKNRHTFDNIVYSFVVIDTNEEIKIDGNWIGHYEGIQLNITI